MNNKRISQLLQLIVDNKDREHTLRAETTEDGTNCIYIYDVIDSWWGVSAEDVGKALDGFGGKDISVYINSPGGDVFEGRAIQSRLKAYSGNVHVVIDGLAASAATTVALGADKVSIFDGAFFMIHNAWTLAFGNKSDLTKTVSLLEKIDDAIGKDYAVATGESHDQIVEWMDDETWFTAAEAKAHGFVSDIITGDSATSANNRAAWNLAAYKNVPTNYSNSIASEPEQPDREKMGRYVDMLERIG